MKKLREKVKIKRETAVAFIHIKMSKEITTIFILGLTNQLTTNYQNFEIKVSQNGKFVDDLISK